MCDTEFNGRVLRSLYPYFVDQRQYELVPFRSPFYTVVARFGKTLST